MKKIVLTALVALFAAGSLTACGGGGATVKSEITTTTRGQQLVDLKKAFDDGAITEDEYKTEKSRVLSSN